MSWKRSTYTLQSSTSAKVKYIYKKNPTTAGIKVVFAWRWQTYFPLSSRSAVAATYPWPVLQERLFIFVPCGNSDEDQTIFLPSQQVCCGWTCMGYSPVASQALHKHSMYCMRVICDNMTMGRAEGMILALCLAQEPKCWEWGKVGRRGAKKTYFV